MYTQQQRELQAVIKRLQQDHDHHVARSIIVISQDACAPAEFVRVSLENMRRAEEILTSIGVER